MSFIVYKQETRKQRVKTKNNLVRVLTIMGMQTNVIYIHLVFL